MAVPWQKCPEFVLGFLGPGLFAAVEDAVRVSVWMTCELPHVHLEFRDEALAQSIGASRELAPSVTGGPAVARLTHGDAITG